MDTRSDDSKRRKVPFGQIIFDDVYLLIGLGLGLPLVSYVVWSLLDLSNVPAHP